MTTNVEIIKILEHILSNTKVRKGIGEAITESLLGLGYAHAATTDSTEYKAVMMALANGLNLDRSSYETARDAVQGYSALRGYHATLILIRRTIAQLRT